VDHSSLRPRLCHRLHPLHPLHLPRLWPQFRRPCALVVRVNLDRQAHRAYRAKTARMEKLEKVVHLAKLARVLPDHPRNLALFACQGQQDQRVTWVRKVLPDQKDHLVHKA